ncbi:bifunctional nuclease [Asimina triloba]
MHKLFLLARFRRFKALQYDTFLCNLLVVSIGPRSSRFFGKPATVAFPLQRCSLLALPAGVRISLAELDCPWVFRFLPNVLLFAVSAVFPRVRLETEWLKQFYAHAFFAVVEVLRPIFGTVQSLNLPSLVAPSMKFRRLPPPCSEDLTVLFFALMNRQDGSSAWTSHLPFWFYSLPVNGPFVYSRVLRSSLWGSKVSCRKLIQFRVSSPHLYSGMHRRIFCTFSSSSNGNGRKAENFGENDEDYVNSSVVEAVEVKSGADGFVIKMRDGRHLRCVHNNPQGGHLPDYAPHPAIVLKMEDGSDLLLPIIVLEMPSVLLMAAIRNVHIARPTLYQIMKEMIVKMGYSVKLVRVTKRVNEAYLAQLYIEKVGDETETVSFDLRPSDAINIAVRCKVPIQVNKHLAYSDGMRVVEPAKVSVQSSISDGLLFTELDRPDGQPCVEAKEFNLIRNMLIAVVEERYVDAGCWDDIVHLLPFHEAHVDCTSRNGETSLPNSVPRRRNGHDRSHSEVKGLLKESFVLENPVLVSENLNSLYCRLIHGQIVYKQLCKGRQDATADVTHLSIATAIDLIMIPCGSWSTMRRLYGTSIAFFHECCLATGLSRSEEQWFPLNIVYALLMKLRDFHKRGILDVIFFSATCSRLCPIASVSYEIGSGKQPYLVLGLLGSFHVMATDV